tara:strand:+ start:783 stop:1952 length:1170 start_codon:yes stop_codon:yes gene_type:complete
LTIFKKQLKTINDSGYLRKRITVDDIKASHLKIENNQVISFASNDYLGMSKNAAVVRELNNSANKYGIGSGSSPLISGYSKSSHFLEKEIAEYLDAESCVVLNSGYLANICLLNIFDNEMNVIQDRESHNSIIESSKINKIKLNRYKHLDNKHLESYLEKKKNQILFSESVFSMSGDVTNIKQHYAIKKKYGAFLFVDDAHGFGIAKPGKNLTPLENSCNMFNVKPSSVDAYMGTFGKAVGTIGAFICGNKSLIEMIIQKGKPYIYSTALPRCIIDATRKSLNILVKNKKRYKKLHDNISYFDKVCQRKNIEINSSSVPIKTYHVGNPKLTMEMRDKFLKDGIFVQGIRYPTVPKGQDKIRMTITANHTKKDIDKLLNTLENIICEKSE